MTIKEFVIVGVIGTCIGASIGVLTAPAHAESTQDVLNSWIGHRIEELYNSWGQPDQVYGNRSVYSKCSQRFSYQSTNGPFGYGYQFCQEYTFTTSDGRITNVTGRRVTR